MTSDNQNIYQSYFSFSLNFFQLVENVLLEMIANKNIDFYFGKPREDIVEHYRQITKWSDFRVFVPILFNFFHGIELLLKGSNYKIGLPAKNPNHNLADNYKQFIENYPNAIIITAIFKKYIFPTTKTCKILRDFFDQNNIPNSSKLFEIFRYPTDKNFQISFNYKDLRNRGELGLDFFNQIIKDIETLRIESEKL